MAGGFLFAVSNDHAETVAESNGKVCEGACREVSRLSIVNADPAMAWCLINLLVVALPTLGGSVLVFWLASDAHLPTGSKGEPHPLTVYLCHLCTIPAPMCCIVALPCCLVSWHVPSSKPPCLLLMPLHAYAVYCRVHRAT